MYTEKRHENAYRTATGEVLGSDKVFRWRKAHCPTIAVNAGLTHPASHPLKD